MIGDVEAFLTDLQLAKRADKTVKDYALILNGLFTFCHKECALDVTADDMRGFLVGNVKRLKNNTYWLYVAKLKTFFRAYNPPIYEWIKKNVKVKIVDAEVEALTKRQLLDLAMFMHDHVRKEGSQKLGETWETIHWFLAAIGCRVGEMCLLNMEDIKIDAKDDVYCIHFKAEITKTKEARDTYIKIASVAGVAFTRYLEKFRKNALKIDPLFVNSLGHRFIPIMIDHKYEVARKRLGITVKCTPHVLRHTYCTFLQEHNVDPKVAAEMTGHSVTTYLKRYGHPTKARKKNIARTYQIV